MPDDPELHLSLAVLSTLRFEYLATIKRVLLTSEAGLAHHSAAGWSLQNLESASTLDTVSYSDRKLAKWYNAQLVSYGDESDSASFRRQRHGGNSDGQKPGNTFNDGSIHVDGPENLERSSQYGSQWAGAQDGGERGRHVCTRLHHIIGNCAFEEMERHSR